MYDPSIFSTTSPVPASAPASLSERAPMFRSIFPPSGFRPYSFQSFRSSSISFSVGAPFLRSWLNLQSDLGVAQASVVGEIGRRVRYNCNDECTHLRSSSNRTRHKTTSKASTATCNGSDRSKFVHHEA